ncbi:aldolase/citrate lyase family protein [uncultured Roseibium sp.]|uniref:aldolase/citrate lyase family protein n=1 Tax=uncultured Roseibium sp. TaxID=1936171 RepID=UPI00374A85B0
MICRGPSEDERVGRPQSRSAVLSLFVPASRPQLIEKAQAANPTCVIADLEDAVAPDEKDAARQALHR